MSTLQPGWNRLVVEFLSKQIEPVTARKAASALGINSDDLTKGEFNALSQVIYNAGWRRTLFWCPPAAEGPWNETEAVA